MLLVETNQLKKGSFLDHLIKGIEDAVVQANALAENQHIESLRKFLNEDGTPKTMDWVINGDKVNKDFLEEAEKEKKELDESYQESRRQTKERKV